MATFYVALGGVITEADDEGPGIPEPRLIGVYPNEKQAHNAAHAAATQLMHNLPGEGAIGCEARNHERAPFFVMMQGRGIVATYVVEPWVMPGEQHAAG